MTQNLISKALEILKDVNKEDVMYNLSEDETKAIKELIELDKYDKEHELRILRNYIVLALHKDFKEDCSNLKENQMLITILTSMIDNKIWSVGGAV